MAERVGEAVLQFMGTLRVRYYGQNIRSSAPCMLVTLEVSKFTGRLKAVALANISVKGVECVIAR